MDPKNTTTSSLATPVAAGLDLTEELPADIDEPPEMSLQHINFWLPPKPLANNAYTKAVPPAYLRRESLLTRQLHSETEHSDEEPNVRSPARGYSMVSTWSNPSTVSTAELTSDDGRSMPSPGISPLLPPTNLGPAAESNTPTEPKILGLDTVAVKDPVEAGLGRKRCITFACGGANKEKSPVKHASPPSLAASKDDATPAPPKRKCALKFMCPSKPLDDQQKQATAAVTTAIRRLGSPAPRTRRTSTSSSSPKMIKVHRGSDSTVTNLASPRTPRKTSSSQTDRRSSPRPSGKTISAPQDDNSDESGGEATRFHEFAISEDEPDEWTQESTCYRSRLCVTDTLRKENVIRQLGQEAEEEVLAEEQDEEEDEEEEVDEEDQDDELDVAAEDEDDGQDKDDNDNDDDNAESDAGFHSDDEGGFAGSDSEGEGSDNEWWTPGGISTAATSTDHLGHHATRMSVKTQASDFSSSLASNSSANVSPGTAQRHRHHRRRPRTHHVHSATAAVQIQRPGTPDLPDSTDFVCGTLDEDRPQEQAYINMIKTREAAKHRPVPQDIDPTFPTSDPEMDEEDDEDIEDPEESSAVEEIMHGSLDSIHGTARRVSPIPRRNSIQRRSPVPAAIRHRSPAPVALRHRSPAPVALRHRSPAPAAVRAKSPAPKPKTSHRSPPPPTTTARAKSPAPRKLFGHSPRHARSPAPTTRMTSPPNTRRASPSSVCHIPGLGLAERPNTLTVAASLPKRPCGFLISRLGQRAASDGEDGNTPPSHDLHQGRRRGAIDIVKGLEKKKQRRREKLCQKLAAKAAARGEERKKIKPGRGAERMREVGLELQKYKGRAGHILSY